MCYKVVGRLNCLFFVKKKKKGKIEEYKNLLGELRFEIRVLVLSYRNLIYISLREKKV